MDTLRWLLYGLVRNLNSLNWVKFETVQFTTRDKHLFSKLLEKHILIHGLNYKLSISTMEVFHLIIQTSVTSFLVFIPVTLIFFLFINFFHQRNNRDVMSAKKNVRILRVSGPSSSQYTLPIISYLLSSRLWGTSLAAQ